jgi:AraC family transcriptional activator FtrA
MPKESSHRVTMIVDHSSNPFELGVATELFGLRRPELDRE